MTTMKKLASLVLAILMLCVCVAANAATITMADGDSDSTYSIYRILDATVSQAENGDTNIAYTINPKYESVLDPDIITQLEEKKKDSVELDEMAKQIYDKIKDNSIAPDYTVTGNTASQDVGTGYVLIAETDLGENAAATYSLIMLNTAMGDNIIVSTKESAPQLSKKVKEINDSDGTESDWQDGADYDKGDQIEFKLTGTLSNRYDRYETYYYKFTDHMSAGLDYNEDYRVVVVNGAAETDVTSYFQPTVTGDDFTLECLDLKAIPEETVEITKESDIVVYYTATLKEGCVVGAEGNPNEAKLTYNNNPYYDGADGNPGSDANTSETPWDKVRVYTYTLKVDKVDGNDQALNGATFELKKKVMNEGVVEYKQVAKIVGTDISTFEFDRLDAGEYVLTETNPPAGYNAAADITFTIEATYDTENVDPVFGTLTVNNEDVSADPTTGILTTTVQNLTGTELPTTGGIGTTIFYVVGGVLVLLAVVLLVTKRRVGEEN